MTTGYTPEGYVLTMTYDAENRLKTAEYTDGSAIVHRTEYYYSGDGLLAEMKKYEKGTQVKDTRFIRAGFLPVQERDGTNALTREYIWGLDSGGGIGGLLNLKQGGTDYSYLYNGKGDVTALIGSNQSVVATYTYDPFGVLMNRTGTLNQPYMFSTKEYDLETGLSYYGYRFYNPSSGRWMTRDPLGEVGGINLYGFVGNNPINFIDPLGLASKEECLKNCSTNYQACVALATAGNIACSIAAQGVCKLVCLPLIEVPPLYISCLRVCTVGTRSLCAIGYAKVLASCSKDYENCKKGCEEDKCQ